MLFCAFQVTTNGEVDGEFDSNTGLTCGAFVIQAVGVETLTLRAVGLGVNDWISFTEVSDTNCRPTKGQPRQFTLLCIVTYTRVLADNPGTKDGDMPKLCTPILEPAGVLL